MIRQLINKIQSVWVKSSSQRLIKFYRSKGVKIGSGTKIFQSNDIHIDLTRPTLVEIGNNVALTKGLTILTHGFDWMVLRNKFGELIPSSGKVKIGNNVFIGFNTTVLKGVEIGDDCIIGAGSVVNKSIPSGVVAAGVPAKIICTIEEYREKRKKESVQEALEYAHSIRENRGEEPVIKDFWEEFPLFMKGDELHDDLPVKKQLGDMYPIYSKTNKPVFESFESFLTASKK